MRIALALILAAGLAACSGSQDETEEAGAVTPASTDDTDAAANEEAAGLPGTDIHIYALNWSGNTPSLGARIGGVTRPGYDNQPFFTPDGTGLLYTAGDPATGETDVWRLDLETGETIAVTQTPDESEYSPRIAPDGILSYIYQPPGGYAGNVYLHHVESGERVSAEALAPVGYYVFSRRMDFVATFALGEPNRLALIDRTVTPEAVTYLADNPGRTFARSEAGHIFVSIEDENGRHRVHALDPETGELSPRFLLPDTWQDFAVLFNPEGRYAFFAAGEETLQYRSRQQRETFDLGELGLSGVTRVAVSPDATQIAIVAEE